MLSDVHCIHCFRIDEEVAGEICLVLQSSGYNYCSYMCRWYTGSHKILVRVV